MANSKHFQILSQGAEAWNRWRNENPKIRPDLSGADLSRMNLVGAYLSDADLSEANLQGANLRRAQLNRANLRGANLESADLTEADIVHAILAGANLTKANLTSAEVQYSDLSDADFSGANLTGGQFYDAMLNRARFVDTDLTRANFSGADFQGANLSGSDLKGTTLRKAKLYGVDLRDAMLVETDLEGLDLNQLIISEEARVLIQEERKKKMADPHRAAVAGSLGGYSGNQGEEPETDVHQALDLFWAKRTRERARPLKTAAPPLPPDSGVSGIRKKLRAIFRRVRARFADRDPVDFTIFSPPVVRSGEAFMVQVFAHRPDQARMADQLAKEFDEDATRRGYTSLETEVERGDELTVHLSLPGLQVRPRVEGLAWDGEPRAVQFDVLVPAEMERGNVVGTVMISKNNVPLGHIKFKLTVEETSAMSGATRNVPAGESAHRYRKAFISYASQDRAEVIKRVQMLRSLRISYFQDLLNLEPGTRWDHELYQHIDDSDLFLLFWSSAAKRSQWVMREVNYALKRQSGSEMLVLEIIPVIIEGPPVVEPPRELAHLHFNDYLVYFTR